MRKIVVDIYGADAGIQPVVLGTAKAIKDGVDFFPILVGDATEIHRLMEQSGICPASYEVIDTDKFITNNDPPTCIFGGMDDSSMAMAYTRLKQDADCCGMLSAGSTGALLVGSICRLGLLPGLKFPALASALPCGAENLVCLVDCGASLDCTPNDLARFAKMGAVLAQSFCGIENPRVGLLSVGREEGKGTELTRQAYDKIKELPLNFVGNVEGSDLVSGYADVVVADGFSGNVLLKSTESAGKVAMEIARQIGGADPELTERICHAIWKKFDFNSQGAAVFLGPKKIITKMHGCANEDTTVASIKQILKMDAAGFSSAMADALRK